MFLELMFLKKKRVAGLQPIYKYNLCAARKIVYNRFPLKKFYLRCNFNFLENKFQDLIYMVLFFLIYNFGLKLFLQSFCYH